ncbi:MAG: hypothetical protein ACXWPJ_06465, partial [Candidatus Limnocylindrales bacterium]
VVVLGMELAGLESVRGIEIQKFRGGAQMAGRHMFDPDPAGGRIAGSRSGVLLQARHRRAPSEQGVHGHAHHQD